MSADVLALLVPLVAIPFGCATTGVLAALLFPTTRHAMADWLHRRANGGLASGSAMDHLASANAQLAALRGEVYALRCEVAALTQSLPHMPQAPALNAETQSSST